MTKETPDELAARTGRTVVITSTKVAPMAAAPGRGFGLSPASNATNSPLEP
jgi:hypothetical protein